jgi:outer membrane protein assembly factor BamB
MKSCRSLAVQFVLGLGLTLSLTSVVPAEDWPQWLGVRRDGCSKEKVIPWKEKESPRVLWSEKATSGYSAPVVAGGLVFLHMRGPDTEKEEEMVVARDAVTGQLKWQDTYPRPTFKSVLGTGPRATPTVAGKRLFTFGINGILSAYEWETGKRLWQVDLYKELKADLPAFAVCTSPLVVGNRVIVSVGGKGKCVVAVGIESGKILWQALDDAASTSSPVLFAGGGRPAGAAPDVVFMTPLRLVGLDPLDGSLRWQYPMIFQAQGTSPTPVISGNQLVTSTQAHGALAVSVGLQDDKAAARQGWQASKLKSYFSSGVAVPGGLIVLVTNEVQPLPKTSLSCVDARSGKLLWTRERVGYFHAGVIRTGDGKLLLLGDNGVLSLLQVDAKGAKELCRAKVCGGTLVNPALANGRLYVRDDKHLICLQVGG